MFANIEHWMKLLSKYRVSADEMMILYLLYKQDHNLIYKFCVERFLINRQGNIIKFQKIGTEEVAILDKAPLTRQNIQNLIDLGYIRNFKFPSLDEAIFSTDLELTDQFRDTIFADTFEGGEELFEEYPDFVEINGKYAPLKVCKGIGRMEVKRIYMESIQHSRELHEEILSKIRDAKERDDPYIRVAIVDFVQSELWKQLGGQGNSTQERYSI